MISIIGMRFFEHAWLDAGLRAGDLNDVLIYFSKLLMGRVEMIDRRTQRVSKLLHVCLKDRYVLPELTDPHLDIFCLLLDLETAQTLQDRLKIGHEAGRAN